VTVAQKSRRQFLTLLAVASAAVLTGCEVTRGNSDLATRSPVPGVAGPTPSPWLSEGHAAGAPGQAAVFPVGPRRVLPPIPPPNTGSPPRVFSHLPRGPRTIALTIDDGYDAETVAAYVQFARDTGIALSFSPNGSYFAEWAPHAIALRPLLERGQVQILNHTFHHPNMTHLPGSRIREELERNDEWIQRTFGTTTRPWWRPPYGAHDKRTDTLAANLGYSRTLLWNGSLGDSRLLRPARLLQEARRYIQPGVILLGHANHPTVTHLYDELVALIRDRNLTPVTLDQAFGTSRATG